MFEQLEKIFEHRFDLYEELSPAGKRFVDAMALKLIAAQRERRDLRDEENAGRTKPSPTHKNATPIMGIMGGRELALALLQHCWNGELPKGDWQKEFEDAD